MCNKNIYIESLHRNLPRLLSSFNMDTLSPFAGVGDRLYWSWKIIDFPNGTFQGAVHGLAILTDLNKLPFGITQKSMLKKIDYIVRGIEKIISKNGSLGEALPNESSLCVSALVASDVLAAREILIKHLSKRQKTEWMMIIKPLIKFLMKQDEYHGLISNHLASASLAMYRWHKITKDKKAEMRGRMWLDRILQHQSSEGWFEEYGSADPGYQSWCITQLAQLHLLRPDLKLNKPLSRSLEFLTYAAHPDGSFGGNYGSRNTRFLLPGGLEIMKKNNKFASTLSKFAEIGVHEHKFVTLDSIDTGNLVPIFNDYAIAAYYKNKVKKETKPLRLPYQKKYFKTWFSKSGWLVESGKGFYTIINFKKGGAYVHFKNLKERYEDPGFVAKSDNGKLLTSFNSKALNIENLKLNGNKIEVNFKLSFINYKYPTPIKFIILRILSLTAFKSLYVGNTIKKFLAGYLIKESKISNIKVERHFILGKNFKVKNKIHKQNKLKVLENNKNFSNMHMASQGYWQISDDEN